MAGRFTLGSAEALDALAQELSESVEQTKPESHQILYRKGWRPKLNPIQKEAVSSKSIFKIYSGPRGSGKTFCALHELVDFLYRNDNELAYIIVKEIGMGTEGGAWQKLNLDILPEWKHGLGIEYNEGTDFRTKSPYVWISNRHGGWSMCMLKSMPVAAHVEGKIRGREPGFIMVDEAQNLESDTYFTSLLMQLGRRKSVSEPSKLVFCCNPEGPSHWLYKRFFLMPVNESDGTWDERYAHFHIPYSDNKDNLPPRYYEDYVIPAVANDPIAKARLVDGLWIDRPDAAALFSGKFVEGVHMRGDEVKGIGLLPVLGQPMITGWDPGSAHTSVHFVQIVPTLDRIYKLCIDELDYVGKYTPYERVVADVIIRMQYWEKKCNTEFRWEHISDDSAFNVFRPGTGSYDVQDIEKHSRNYVERNNLPPRFIIRMKPAPKGEHSIEARVRMLTDDLVTSSFLMSATCRRTKEMFLYLPEDPDNRMNPRRKSRYLHNFSSLTYPLFFFHCRRVEVPGATDHITPMYYSAT
jgi:hypothetical protein